MTTTQNVMIVGGISPGELEEAALELMALYRDTSFVNEIYLRVHQKTENLFLLEFPGRPDFERFCYFVNFFNYPTKTRFSGKVSVTGYWNLEADSVSGVSGKEALIYVSEKDTEFDNVWLVTNNQESFKYDFGGRLKRLPASERNFQGYPYSEDDFRHHLDLVPEGGNSIVQEIPARKGCAGFMFAGILVFTWMLGSLLYGV